MQDILQHVSGAAGQPDKPRYRILITVQGGVIQDIDNIPSHITVEIHDYDVEGYTGDALCRPSGEPPFILSEWTGE